MNLFIRFVSVLVLLYQPLVHGHTYHVGETCAKVEPMPGFNMDKFTGKWYAIQKTSTASRCVLYNFKKTEFRSTYKLQQLSENPVVAVGKSNTFNYTGDLTVPDEKNQAQMTAKFPFTGFTGGAEYIVFMTDYENYAGVYTCQKLVLAHRESATILSRTKTLDKAYIDKIRNKLASFNVNPFDMSEINQTDCNLNTDFRISVDDHTFSKENIKKTVKVVGTKIGEGVEFLVKGSKKLYDYVTKDGNNNGEKSKYHSNNNNRDREDVTERDYGYIEPNAELL